MPAIPAPMMAISNSLPALRARLLGCRTVGACYAGCARRDSYAHPGPLPQAGEGEMRSRRDMAEDSDEYDDEIAEPAPPAEVPEPRANPYLAGHEAAEASLIAAHAQGKLPHAIIIGGPRGIGKSTLAFRLARFVLSQGTSGAGLFAAAPASLALAEDHPVFSRVASGGHADLLTIERGINPNKWKKRDAPPDAEARKRVLRDEIVVDDTREVANFLRLTAAEGGWRIVIVDSADDMNRNAANALLKILEEPPSRSLLLLVSHAPGRLLPTIRSRCR